MSLTLYGIWNAEILATNIPRISFLFALDLSTSTAVLIMDFNSSVCKYEKRYGLDDRDKDNS